MNRPVLLIVLAAFGPIWVLEACVGSDRTVPRSEVHGLDDPDAVILRVRVVSAEITDFYDPNRGCPLEPDDSQCIQWIYWVKYRAKVLRVESGRWTGAVVDFANYQHSKYQLKFVNDCYVVLVRASADFEDKLGVSYISTDMVLPRRSEDRGRVRAVQSASHDRRRAAP